MRQRTTIMMGCLTLALGNGCSGRIDGAADKAGAAMTGGAKTSQAPGAEGPRSSATPGGPAGPAAAPGPGAAPAAPAGPVAAAPFRRLTRTEYINAVNGLLGRGTSIVSDTAFPDDNRPGRRSL